MGLILDVELPADGPVWQELNTKICDHLSSKDIAYADLEGVDRTPHNSPFVLLTTSQRAANNGAWTYRTESFLTVNNYTARTLSSDRRFTRISNHVPGSPAESMLIAGVFSLFSFITL